MKLKRMLSAAILALAMTVSLLPIAASAAPGYDDISGHWAENAIVKWSGMGIVEGYNGRFFPADPVTRGDMAVILGRMMNYPTAAPNTFADLGEAYYSDAVLKAVAAGVILGDGNLIRPESEITREEAAVMLARAFGMTESDGEAEFSDTAHISTWALGYVSAMAARGYMNGYQGAFNPKGLLSRAEVVTVLDNAVGGLYTVPAEYSGNVSGIAVISTPGVILKDMVIDGDLIISQGAGAGEVALNNVIVTGSMIVRGGGVQAAGVLIGTAGITGAGVRLELDAASEVKTLNICETAAGTKLLNKGLVGTLNIDGAADIQNSGTIRKAVAHSSGIIFSGSRPLEVVGEIGVLGEKDTDDGIAVPGGGIPSGGPPVGPPVSPPVNPPVNPPEEVIATAPSFLAAYPKTANVMEDSISILVKADKTVTYYAVAFKKTGRPEPSAAQVIDGTDGDDSGADRRKGRWGPLDGDMEVSLDFKYLSGSTTYDIFIVAVDKDGNSSDVVKMEVTTQANQVISPPAWAARDGAADRGITLHTDGLDETKVSGGLYVFELKYYGAQDTELSESAQVPVSNEPYDMNKALAYLPAGTAAVKARICQRGVNQMIPVSDFSKALSITFTEPATSVTSFTYDNDSRQYTLKFSEPPQSHVLYVGYLKDGVPVYQQIYGIFAENTVTFTLPTSDLQSSITVCEITGASVSVGGEASLTVARQADVKLK